MNNRRKNIRHKIDGLYSRISLRNAIWISFTLSAAMAAILIGISFYSRFTIQLHNTIQKENQSIIEQVNNTLTIYLRNMMSVSDSLYYNVLKDVDLEDDSIIEQVQLLYDTNRESITHIVLFSEDGKLIEVSPAAILKEDVDVTEKDWFLAALNKTEDMHFFNPKVSNLFNSTDHQYQWVVSLSRAVQMNRGKQAVSGVMLVELKYSRLELMFNNVSLGNNGYLYLTDKEGNIIYHPSHQLIDSSIVSENNLLAATYKDGNHEEVFNGEERIVSVKSVGYTGWKIIGVTPKAGIELNSLKSSIFILFIFFFFLTILGIINTFISSRVSDPILKLEQSVGLLAKGNLDTPIDVEGFQEVQHLGTSIQEMAARIKKLMKDVVKEQESKRKSELDTLQSQINPHFLYNTLDIIVWMIENEKKSEAVKVVLALARFFRISLSKGKNMITLEDELEHVRNYLMIQTMRYKNRFHFMIEVSEDIKQLAMIKLVLQPLVENAIYHGMEFMDGEGLIKIQAAVEASDLYIRISDNGLGMNEETVSKLLDGEIESRSKGSGIGVKNVNERIRLYFGDAYGLIIESEPDEGTVMTLHLPAIPYDEMKEREV